jgi:predicted DNA-binding transcriptional regulator AlpA
MNDDIWTAKEIAQYLKVCPRYVAEKLSKQHGFPARLAVGRGRWLREEIIQWVYQNRRAA